jgi:transposase InsO family protein
VPARVNDVWGLDFVADQLADGTRLRALTIVDVFSREALGTEVSRNAKKKGPSSRYGLDAIARPVEWIWALD